MADLNVNSIGDASGGNTATINTFTPTLSNMAGRNRIINGDMRISQRYGGASVAAGNSYTLDRWVVRTDTGSGNTTQQSTTAPAGFKNSLIVAIGTGASPTTTQRNYIQQNIEGLNLSDMGFGTASAATFTISFWVQSSLTGTFGGVCINSDNTRSYPFTYVINSPNTWEQKSLTIAGDTSGSNWITTNGVGLQLLFDLGSGATFQGTAGAWATADYRAASGCVQLAATSGATFYITGVQLEAGSVATPFEHRQYGQELALCQRYYLQYGKGEDLFGIAGGYFSSTEANACIQFPVSMRTAPTLTAASGSDYYRFYRAGGSNSVTTLLANGTAVSHINLTAQSGQGASGTAGNFAMLQIRGASAGGLVQLSAEL